MANLSIRRVEEDVYRRLRVRAAEHGVSMEEEVRQILARAVAAPDRLGDLAITLFGADQGVDFELPTRRPHDPLKLE